MIIKNLCILVLRMKVASALEGLKILVIKIKNLCILVLWMKVASVLDGLIPIFSFVSLQPRPQMIIQGSTTSSPRTPAPTNRFPTAAQTLPGGQQKYVIVTSQGRPSIPSTTQTLSTSGSGPTVFKVMTSQPGGSTVGTTASGQKIMVVTCMAQGGTSNTQAKMTSAGLDLGMKSIFSTSSIGAQSLIKTEQSPANPE